MAEKIRTLLFSTLYPSIVRLATSAAATIDRLDLTWLGNARKVAQLAGKA